MNGIFDRDGWMDGWMEDADMQLMLVVVVVLVMGSSFVSSAMVYEHHEIICTQRTKLRNSTPVD